MWTESQAWQALLEGADACILLARGHDVPAGLLRSLEASGVDAAVIGHPLLAFSELLLRDTPERRLRHRPDGWGLPPRAKLVFIVADRDRWAHLDALLAAIRHFVPSASIWIGVDAVFVEATRADRPSGLRLAGDTAPEMLAPPPPASPPSRPPSSRVGEASPESAGESSEPIPPPRRSRASLEGAVTTEEIDMLLRLFDSDDPERRDSTAAPDRPRGESPTAESRKGRGGKGEIDE